MCVCRFSACFCCVLVLAECGPPGQRLRRSSRRLHLPAARGLCAELSERHGTRRRKEGKEEILFYYTRSGSWLEHETAQCGVFAARFVSLARSAFFFIKGVLALFLSIHVMARTSTFTHTVTLFLLNSLGQAHRDKRTAPAARGSSRSSSNSRSLTRFGIDIVRESCNICS